MTGEDDPKLATIKQERGYSYTDICTVHPDKLPGYETKILSFFEGIYRIYYYIFHFIFVLVIIGSSNVNI